MTQSPAEPDGQPPYLVGLDAQAWFYGLPRAGQILDAHLIAISTAFGPGVGVQYRAPVSQSTGKAQYLLLELDVPVDDPDVMNHLVDVQMALLAQRDVLRDRAEIADPLANIVVTIGQAPADWETFLSNLVTDQ